MTLSAQLRAWALAVLAAATAAPVIAAAPTAPSAAEWNFRALLDGKPIGQHRFSLSTQGDERQLISEASFAIKVLGITAYRYRHKATEQWHGDCLTALSSTTDDDGAPSTVRAETLGELLSVKVATAAATATQALSGCVMSFAYWNPAIQTQTRLLNAQTGKAESVQVSRVGSGSVEVRGQSVAATQFRITGPAQPIDVWYSLQGDWVGLDSTVAGGRKLSYRLE